MTLLSATLDALRDGPRSKTEIEHYLASVGYAPAGVNYAVPTLKRRGLIRHLRRASRHVTSLYALENDNEHETTTHP